MLPIALLGFGALSALAWHKAGEFHGEPKALPPSLQYALNRILDGKLSPEKYLRAAEMFRKHGLRAEAELLKKRAKLAALPNSEKKKITEAYGKAMRSNKPEGIRSVAEVLESLGAVGAAANLREQANKVQAANAIQPVDIGVPEPIDDDPPPPVDILREEEKAIIDADIAPVPPLTSQLEADAATGQQNSPATGMLAEPPPPLPITDDLPDPPELSAADAIMLTVNPKETETASIIEAARSNPEEV